MSNIRVLTSREEVDALEARMVIAVQGEEGNFFASTLTDFWVANQDDPTVLQNVKITAMGCVLKYMCGERDTTVEGKFDAGTAGVREYRLYIV